LCSLQAGRFQGKVVVVTGASSGIGLGTAELLAAEGAKIVAVGRRKDALDEAAKKIKAAGAKSCANGCVLGFLAPGFLAPFQPNFYRSANSSC
jgi:NAD(P)-dependent dehydrogenase (short-subunit alcohol dehydrogenase family)